jgi:hypothetical protein
VSVGDKFADCSCGSGFCVSIDSFFVICFVSVVKPPGLIGSMTLQVSRRPVKESGQVHYTVAFVVVLDLAQQGITP